MRPLSDIEEGDKDASYNDRGIDEVLEVVRLLREDGIICCIVGGNALRYYGVPRATIVSFYHSSKLAGR